MNKNKVNEVIGTALMPVIIILVYLNIWFFSWLSFKILLTSIFTFILSIAYARFLEDQDNKSDEKLLEYLKKMSK